MYFIFSLFYLVVSCFAKVSVIYEFFLDNFTSYVVWFLTVSTNTIIEKNYGSFLFYLYFSDFLVPDS